MPKVQRNEHTVKKEKNHVFQNRKVILDKTQNVGLSKSPNPAQDSREPSGSKEEGTY